MENIDIDIDARCYGYPTAVVALKSLRRDRALLAWLLRSVLTDSQLDVVPPGYRRALRFQSLSSN